MPDRHLNLTLEWFLSQCCIKKYRAKHSIGRGEASRLFYLLDGSATLFVRSPEGKEMILSALPRGAFIGESGLFQLNMFQNTWVRAKTACEVAEIPHSQFLKLIPLHPDLLLHLTHQLALRWQEIARRLSHHLFLDVTGRILQSLVTLAMQPEAMSHPQGVQIHSTRQEIGQLAGCSRETAGRALKQLAAQNVLSAHGKTIILHHQQAA